MKYLHPVSIYWNWIASKKKMCSKMSSFCLVKKRPPPPPPCKWEWIGAIRRPLRKTDKIFNERKDDILLSCKQILNCLFAFWNICLTKLQFSRRIIIVPPQNAIFGPNVSPWCPVQVFVRSQTNATLSSFIWSTNYIQSIWGKVLFDHFQFAIFSLPLPWKCLMTTCCISK